MNDKKRVNIFTDHKPNNKKNKTIDDDHPVEPKYYGVHNIKNKPKFSMMSKYLMEKGFNRSSIESYNYFVMNEIPQIFNGITFDVPNGRVILTNTMVLKPTLYTTDNIEKPLYPAEALLRNLNYSSQVVCDAYFECNNESDNLFNKPVHNRHSMVLCTIPVMKNSVICNLSTLSPEEREKVGECPYDVSSYFTIYGQEKGSEKCILPSERLSGNTLLCFKNKLNTSVEIRCAGLNAVPKKTSLTFVEKNFGEGIFSINISNNYELNIAVTLKVLGFEPENIIPTLFIYMIYKRNFNFKQLEFIWRLLNNLLEKHVEFVYAMSNDKNNIDEYLAKKMNIQYVNNLNENTRRNIYNKILEDTCSHIKITTDAARITKINLLLVMWSKLCEMIIELPKDASFFLYSNNQKSLRVPDDRDNYANKRNDMPGTLLSVLLHQLKGGFVKETQLAINKDKSSVHPIEKVNKNKTSEKMKKNIEYCMSTGIWGLKTNKQNKVGVSQQLTRISNICALSHTKRINTAIDKTGKQTKPRLVHPSQFGFIDPSETPEGQACGLIKNPSNLQYVSLYRDPIIVLGYIKTDLIPTQKMLNQLTNWIFNVSDGKIFTIKDLKNYDDISTGIYFQFMPFFCNGVMLGWCKGFELMKKLKNLRRAKLIHHDISIYVNIDYELHVNTESGRCMRPLYIVQDNVLLLEKKGYKLDLKSNQVVQVENPNYEPTFIDLENDGCIEYLDGYEIDSLIAPTSVIQIAIKPEQLLKTKLKGSTLPHIENNNFNYLEIDPNCIIGISVALIPFSDHNQAPRNAYQAAMGKQAIGIYHTRWQKRIDTNAKILCYPQKPMVSTEMYRALDYDNIPSGQQAITAICCYGGSNIEDSIIINKAAVDRGFARNFTLHTYTIQEEPSLHKVFGIPPLKPEDPPDKYSHLDENGIPDQGIRVKSGQVLVGKVQMASNGSKSDCSLYLRSRESGIIHSVMLCCGPNNIRYCSITIREERIPELGDKFASTHAQKGTVGCVMSCEDLPWTEQGINPDIILNPHAIPSRMTLGMLKEQIMSKYGLLTGNYIDATAFRRYYCNKPADLEELGHDGEYKKLNVYKALSSLGFTYSGKESMYNGMTGEMLDSVIFIAPTNYQLLKHQVCDKIHARARGSRQQLTRQPLEGRSRDGGHRFGEMERDCMISYASAAWLIERLMKVSDVYEYYICGKCGLPAIADEMNSVFKCYVCNNTTVSTEDNNIYKITQPYITKLLFQELNAMNIRVRQLVKN